MTQHLVLPQFTRDLIDRQSASALAQASVNVMDRATGQPVAVPSEADLTAALEGLKSMGISEEAVQDVAKSLIAKTTTDPVVLLQPYAQPADFAAQYPQPLDPTEILTLCEEIMVWQTLPEVVTPTNADSWREMDELAFDATGETNQGFFLKGGCPDTYSHDGDNQSITRMYLGGQKTLSYEDIKHSLAVASIQGLGISAISTQARRAAVADVKEKEMLLEEILTLNKWDRALVKGNSATNALARPDRHVRHRGL
jgi:hypothetical protein